MKNKKLMISLLSVVLVLAVVFGVVALRRTPDETAYDDTVFGKQYAIGINLYASFFGSYGSKPVYYLSDDGYLHYISYKNGEKTVEQISDAMESFELTWWNFDSRFAGGSWTAMDVDAQYIREHTVKAWYGVGEDEMLYYVLLQENGDVFLCKGRGTKNRSENLEVKIIGIAYCLRDGEEWEP